MPRRSSALSTSTPSSGRTGGNATYSSHNLGTSVPRSRSSRRGYALIFGVVAILGAGVFAAYMAAVTQDSPPPPSQPDAPPQPASGLEVQAALLRAGFSPGMLTAADVEPSQLDGLFARARSELADRIDTLRNADTTRDQQQLLVRSLEQSMQSMQASPELTAARAALTTTNDQIATIFTAVRSGVESTLTENQVRALANLRTNQSREVPLEYRVVERTDQEWVNLRDALAVKRVGERRGEELSAEALQVLTAADADPAVSTAKTAIAQNSQAVETTWRSAFQQATTEGQGQ